jgi:hypothetical protein
MWVYSETIKAVCEGAAVFSLKENGSEKRSAADFFQAGNFPMQNFRTRNKPGPILQEQGVLRTELPLREQTNSQTLCSNGCSSSMPVERSLPFRF